MTTPGSPLNLPPALSSADEANARLAELAVLRAEMESNFHSYEEINALSASDRDALFALLWDAQRGDPSALLDVYDLIYDEVPVAMDEFILSKGYLGLQGEINNEKMDVLMLLDQPHVRRGYLALGSGSGKSFVVSIMQARAVYSVLCLRRPDLFFMLSPGAGIAAINLSVSKDQARDVVFAEFKARLGHCPWFAGRYKAGSVKAQFAKGVAAFSGGSNAHSYYGYHTIFGSLDEASFMLEGETEVAEELSEALTKSMNTRFPRWWKLLIISTLRSPDDYLALNVERIKDTGVPIVLPSLS